MQIMNTLISSIVYEPPDATVSSKIQHLAYYYHQNNIEEFKLIMKHILTVNKSKGLEIRKCSKSNCESALISIDSEKYIIFSRMVFN
jgi:hypothetical protein